MARFTGKMLTHKNCELGSSLEHRPRQGPTEFSRRQQGRMYTDKNWQ